MPRSKIDIQSKVPNSNSIIKSKHPSKTSCSAGSAAQFPVQYHPQMTSNRHNNISGPVQKMTPGISLVYMQPDPLGLQPRASKEAERPSLHAAL
mmetsp:Transcript_6333/g.15166  ORF Transcript_6333/g.15166 Transcript_6333/m.15166 type:complete len:94 (-) Transcript_6333:4496-4777(-)|eukprot:1010270-Pelagomonas_calceolata.AAC.1